jgi:hypothetical protein
MVYMWDDHDWLGNNAGGDPDELGREAALWERSMSRHERSRQVFANTDDPGWWWWY